MTLTDFRQKRKQIEKTHPAPKNMDEGQKLRFYSKIAQKWIDEMEDLEEVKIAIKEERSLIKKFVTL